MCIAIYSLKGNPAPNDEVLKNCFVSNSDGAGFAFNIGGKVEIRKGFMTYSDFIEAFREYDRLFNFTDRGVLIHFRIATHGGTNEGCCHPFPLSDSKSKLKETAPTSEYAIVHNGIIRLCTDTADTEKDISDTMVFVRDYLSKIATNKKWFDNPGNMKLIEKLIDSKMAILDGNGEIRATSGFTKGKDGNYYSNNSYLDSYRYFNSWCYGYDYDTDSEGYSLMRLKKGEAIYYDDGAVEEFETDYHKQFPTFISLTGNVYACYDGKKIGRTVDGNRLNFVGTGYIVDEKSFCTDSCEPLPFRSDTTVFADDTDDLDWYMYG